MTDTHKQDDGLFAMVRASFKGPMRFWVMYVWFILTVLTVPLVWAIYRLIIANTMEERVLFGIWAILGVMMAMGLKIWYWMEMSRVSLIKRIEHLEGLLKK